MEKEILKQIFNEFLKDIYTLADEDYQKRAWVAGTPGELCDMEEWIGLFLEDGENLLKHKEDYSLNGERLALIESLYKKVEDFDRKEVNLEFSYYDQDIIDRDDWKEVVATARAVMNAFGNPFRISEHLMYKIDRFTNKKMQR